MLIASGLLALLIGAAFAVLLSSVADLRTLERRARQSEEVLEVTNVLERQVVDLETAQRGFVITRQESFLQPWQRAQLAVPEEAATLARLVGNDPERQQQARRIVQAIGSYVRDYSIPLVATVRRDPEAARTVAADRRGQDAHGRHPGRVRPLPGGRAWPGGGARTPLGRGRPAGHRRRGDRPRSGRPCSSPCSPAT